MRKNKGLLCCFLLLACCALFTSCSKDNDENGTEESSSTESAVIPGLICSDKLNLPYGYRLLSWKNNYGSTYTIKYNADGSLQSITSNGTNYQFNNSPFTIDEMLGKEGLTIFDNVSFNQKGYITKFHHNSIIEGQEQEFTISYNASDRISNMNIRSEQYKWKYDDENSVFITDGIERRWTTSISFYYSNDCLTDVKYEASMLEGEPYTKEGYFHVPCQGDIQYSYENSFENLADQFTQLQIIDFIDYVVLYHSELIEGLFYLGYFGKPSKYLPSKISQTYFYDYNFDGEGNKRFNNYDEDIKYTFDKYGVVTADNSSSKFTFTTIRPTTQEGE